jgi:predicted small lipoprotein YifL
MLTRRLAITTVVLALLASFFVVGCGPKPPCPVPPEEVKAAQDKTGSVKTDLDAATAESAKLAKELKDKEAQLKRLKSQDLEKELEMLKTGSGR